MYSNFIFTENNTLPDKDSIVVSIRACQPESLVHSTTRFPKRLRKFLIEEIPNHVIYADPGERYLRSTRLAENVPMGRLIVAGAIKDDCFFILHEYKLGCVCSVYFLHKRAVLGIGDFYFWRPVMSFSELSFELEQSRYDFVNPTKSGCSGNG